MLVHFDETKYEIFSAAERGTQIVGSKTSYFAEDDYVTRIRSSKITGLNRHSGNRYYRWKRESGTKVYRLKDGKIGGTTSNGKAFYSGIDFYTVESDATFRNLANERFGEVAFHNVYPLARHFGLLDSMRIPGALHSALRQDDLGEFTRVAFGKTRYRKDLVKAAAESTLAHISYARDFRGLVPIDWIVDFLRNHSRDDREVRHPYKTTSLRNHILAIDPRSHRNLLREQNVRPQLIADIGRNGPVVRATVERIVGRRFRTVHEIHEAIWERPAFVYTKPEPLPIRDIPVTEIGKTVLGNQPEGMKFVLPRDTSVLEDWSDEMHNCIRGYASDVVRKDTAKVLAGVYQGDKLIANFEISDRRLTQLLGKYNSNLEDDVRIKIEAALSSSGIAIPTDYWGSPSRDAIIF